MSILYYVYYVYNNKLNYLHVRMPKSDRTLFDEINHKIKWAKPGYRLLQRTFHSSSADALTVETSPLVKVKHPGYLPCVLNGRQ